MPKLMHCVALGWPNSDQFRAFFIETGAGAVAYWLGRKGKEMHHAEKSAADLSALERLCLLLIGDGGLETFNPREDEILASLLDMGLIDGHRIDDETATCA